MQLEKIILRDFGCFQGERDFELTEGVNLIFGPNFSGKSTLVNIIFFTLTGKPIVPRVEASAIKNPYAKQGTGTAGLQFAENGSQYQLFRATGKRILLRSPKANGWHIHFDDSRVTFAASQLQERFGLSHQHLALTAFLREGEIFEFLARQPATRRDILYALLGIDRLIEVRERFIDARRLAKGEERRISSYQNSLRFRAQGPHGAEIQKIEAKIEGVGGGIQRGNRRCSVNRRVDAKPRTVANAIGNPHARTGRCAERFRRYASAASNDFQD